MAKIIIGCGGWGYLGGTKTPLRSYSRLFNFVEVNSTFYKIPSLESVNKWRESVPESFEFAVKSHRDLTHAKELSIEHLSKVEDRLYQIVETAKALRSRIIVHQFPATVEPSEKNAVYMAKLLLNTELSEFINVLSLKSISKWLDSPWGKDIKGLIEEVNGVLETDFSSDSEPADSGPLYYSRLFGKGTFNNYQFSDEELKFILDRAKNLPGKKEVVVSFHTLRMYKDAGRTKVFLETGKFPPVTINKGVNGFMEIIQEKLDQFPVTKAKLLEHHGWKYIEMPGNTRILASKVLNSLPEREYGGLKEVKDAILEIIRT